MVESLDELNKLCQKPDYKTKGNWMVRKILRPAALPITWVLLHTSVTANQVTGISIVIGLLGNVFLAMPGTESFLAGVICLQLWYLLDHVDGQIARYRKTSGITGRFYDFTMHHLIHGTLPFALGWNLYGQTQVHEFILFGFVGTISLIFFNMLYDIQYKAFFEKIQQASLKPKQISEPVQKQKNAVKKLWTARGFSIAHKSIEMHVLTNLLTLGAFLEFFLFPAWSFRTLFCFYYCLLLPVLTMTKYVLWISSKRADKEFDALFTNSGETSS